jgi:hypothetical protein
MTKLPAIKNLHTALPLLTVVGSGLNADRQPRSNSVAIINPDQAKPVIRLVRKGK